jgi:hypothetical protein
MFTVFFEDRFGVRHLDSPESKYRYAYITDLGQNAV